MPLSIVCPGCQKKLTVKYEQAGKKVKCPSCGQKIELPNLPARGSSTLAEAVARSDIAGVSRFLNRPEFTLVESRENSTDDGKAALTVEVEGKPMMVAFTSPERAVDFAGAVPELLDDEGSLPGFVVDGDAFLPGVSPGCGIFLDAQTPDEVVIPAELVTQVRAFRNKPAAPKTQIPGGKSPGDLVRKQTLAFLHERGFRPALWLPVPDADKKVRPASEIAARLLALSAIFTWVSAPEDAVTPEQVHEQIRRNGLRLWMTEEEAGILDMSRAQAREEHGNSVGWKLENMWPLAWALGFNPEPPIEASQIPQEISHSLFFEFLEGVNGTLESVQRHGRPRLAAAVIAVEDRFYCAHNAVRSAQVGHTTKDGKSTVPEGFHPIVHGGVIHERRHALTWCLSSGVPWEETDLST